MADVSLEWNGDFQASATGDLALADGDDLSRQQIVRRLMTAVHGYVFHLDYGAGLPQKIGSPARQREIESVIRSQIALEASVDASKPVQIKVTEDQNQFGLFTIFIGYTSADTGQAVQLSLTDISSGAQGFSG
jgi:hypothetical protein